MRSNLSYTLEAGRIREGDYQSATGDLHGMFLIKGPCGKKLGIMSSGVDNHYGWEHVSVSTSNRTPNWKEMCYVKKLFWGAEECVMQLHPPESQYVNYHPYCLHLWRPLNVAIPMPDSALVGPKTQAEVIDA